LDRKKEIEMGKNEPTLDPVTVTISGGHDCGKTTLANLIKMSLEESGYRFVNLKDIEPLPQEEKDRFPERFHRNRSLRAVNICVVLEEQEIAGVPLVKSIHGCCARATNQIPADADCARCKCGRTWFRRPHAGDVAWFLEGV